MHREEDVTLLDPGRRAVELPRREDQGEEMIDRLVSAGWRRLALRAGRQRPQQGKPQDRRGQQHGPGQPAGPGREWAVVRHAERDSRTDPGFEEGPV